MFGVSGNWSSLVVRVRPLCVLYEGPAMNDDLSRVL